MEGGWALPRWMDSLIPPLSSLRAGAPCDWLPGPHLSIHVFIFVERVHICMNLHPWPRVLAQRKVSSLLSCTVLIHPAHICTMLMGSLLRGELSKQKKASWFAGRWRSPRSYSSLLQFIQRKSSVCKWEWTLQTTEIVKIKKHISWSDERPCEVTELTPKERWWQYLNLSLHPQQQQVHLFSF